MKNFLKLSLLITFLSLPGISQAMLMPSYVNFGRILCNTTAMQTVTFINNSGQTLQNVNFSVSGISFFANGFCPYNMAPNMSCSISVTYQPRNQPGSDFATLWVNAFPLSGETASLNGSCYLR